MSEEDRVARAINVAICILPVQREFGRIRKVNDCLGPCFTVETVEGEEFEVVVRRPAGGPPREVTDDIRAGVQNYICSLGEGAWGCEVRIIERVGEDRFKVRAADGKWYEFIGRECEAPNG